MLDLIDVEVEMKPLPILLLLDVSGSMTGTKIDTLNESVRTMLDVFMHAQESGERELRVSVVTFGEQVRRLFPFTRAEDVRFQDLTARGGTPLGTALRMAKAIIEDTDETPRRCYKPYVVLVSDGRPGDRWEEPLQDFVTKGRSSKCYRMALAIGEDADRAVLGKFVEGGKYELWEAHQAVDIAKFFEFVTQITSQLGGGGPIVNGSPTQAPTSPTPHPENGGAIPPPSGNGAPVSSPVPPTVPDGEDEEDVTFL